MTQRRPAPDVVTSSADYALRFAGPVGEYLLSAQTRAALSVLGGRSPGSLADVGGGHAQIAGPLAKRGWTVTVVGSDPSCFSRLTENGIGQQRRACCSDLLALPFASRSFDVVAAFRLLAHIEDWPELVGELCRLARRAVMFDYPERRSVNALAQVFYPLKKAVEGDTRRYRVLSRRAVRRELARRGFDEVARAPQLVLPLALHRAVGMVTLSRSAENVARAVGLTRAFGSPVVALAERREAGAA